MMSFLQHLDALVLALASSMDNFAVGFSIGVGRKILPFWANAMISFCNGLGALFASCGGFLLNDNLPLFAPSLAAIGFGVLGALELVSYSQDSGPISKNVVMSVSHVLRLALPMTLNNVAGGVAGGAIGISPTVSGLHSVLASFLTMHVGHALGCRFGSHKMPFCPSLFSGILLWALCIMTILEMLQ
eukprot:scaffold25915_cov122-Cylindrotheca_fusiformis.AAC.2